MESYFSFQKSSTRDKTTGNNRKQEAQPGIIGTNDIPPLGVVTDHQAELEKVRNEPDIETV